MAIHAWVDESIHLDVAPSGIYVLAAAIGVADSGLGAVRADLRKLVPPRQARLHWHTESDPARRRVVNTVAELPLEHLVVVRVGVDPKRQERARRKCLERLLFELSERGVHQVWLESRMGRLDQWDLKLVDVLRIRGAITESLQVGFARPMDEPMLWVPDAVAGSVALARKGRDAHYRQRLGPALEELEV